MKKVGRYEVVEELGRGATGVVYKALDPTIGRVVALKVLSIIPASAEGIPGAGEIFRREARAAGSLSHPGIVAIHDALEDPGTRASCIVMEFVPGQTLEKVLALRTGFKLERALDIARQVGEALAYAHGRNVIHRDLKPANIILSEDGHAKLTDFGIAKIMASEGAVRTVSTMGTPSYMSPEQVSGGEVDARSDLFSLGIVLYRMLTDEKPFKGDTAAVMFKIAYEDPVLPSGLNNELSHGHDYLVVRCLAKNPNQRYANAREFLDDLEDVRQGRPPRSEAKVPLSEMRVGEPTLISRRPGETFPALLELQGKKKRAELAMGVIVGVGVLGAAAGLWLSLHRRVVMKPPDKGSPNPAAQAPSTSSASAPLPAASIPGATSSPPRKKDPRAASAKKSAAALSSIPQAPVETKAKNSPRGQPAGQRNLTEPAPATSPPAKPAGSAPPALSSAGRLVQVICKHDLVSATLTVSSGNQVISQWTLKGRKKGRFLSRGHTGTLSRPIRIPAGVRELSVRVASEDGSFDLSRPVSATPPAGAPATLEVEVGGARLTVKWQAPPHPKA